jgi:anti-sigma regulatory factor (Ser/Thr protein kinase)
MSRVLIIGSFDPVSRNICEKLETEGIEGHLAAGYADALQQMRMRAFSVVVTSPETPIDEDLALLEEMRLIRPAVRCITLAPKQTPGDVIVAMRAHVFACFSAPYDVEGIVEMARKAALNGSWKDGIEIVSARPGWVNLRISSQQITAERVMSFAREMNTRLPSETRSEMMQALHEILMNAMEHGAGFNPDVIIEITVVRTARTVVFYVRDPGPGFRRSELAPGTVAHPFETAAAHAQQRDEAGLRPGGYGLLVAGGTVDELIYNDIGNEVVMIKYTDHLPPNGGS